MKLKIIAAAILLVLGGIATIDLMSGPEQRILPAPIRNVVFIGPALVALGLPVLVRCCAAGRKICSRRNVFITGIALLGSSAAFFIYVLATDHGGDASWGNGMKSIMGIIFVGLPGLVLSAGALLIKRTGHGEDTARG